MTIGHDATVEAAPSLLNDDGTASGATLVMMSHHGMRRDLGRFALALAQPGLRADAVRAEWTRLHATLEGHHHAEDEGIFPGLRSEHPVLGPVFDRLTADHRRIDPLLERGDRAFAGLPGTVAEAAAVVGELSALLDAHLALEEARVIPYLRGAGEFPPPPTDEALALYADGFAWSYDGVAAEVLERVEAMLPPSLVARLPAARAAFEARCAAAWGPRPSGASTTPIPDWLAGRAS
jgi:hypothetical protein